MIHWGSFALGAVVFGALIPLLAIVVGTAIHRSGRR